MSNFTISSLLKQVMAAMGLQQKDLAEVLHVSLDRVKSLTSGKVKKLSSEETCRLVQALNLSAHWLATGEGPMRQDDDETQDEFATRMQAINRMHALINAMPLREFSRMRLCMLMTGDPVQDGTCIANAIRNEALGLDFVTGKPIEGANAPMSMLPPDEAALLDNYRNSPPDARAAIKSASDAFARPTGRKAA